MKFKSSHQKISNPTTKCVFELKLFFALTNNFTHKKKGQWFLYSLTTWTKADNIFWACRRHFLYLNWYLPLDQFLNCINSINKQIPFILQTKVMIVLWEIKSQRKNKLHWLYIIFNYQILQEQKKYQSINYVANISVKISKYCQMIKKII